MVEIAILDDEKVLVDSLELEITALGPDPDIRTDRLEELIEDRRQDGKRSRDEVVTEMTAEIPAGRLGEPQELAALVAFLMSRQAAYITGQCIVADGGWVRATF